MSVPECSEPGPIAECWIVTPKGQMIGFTQEDADAALIVTAVNAHDALLAALRALVEACDEYVLNNGPERDGALFTATHPARALLRDLSGEEEGQ